MNPITNNEKAFLATITLSELGADLVAASDHGYNVVVGSTPKHPKLFSSYADHPRILVNLPNLGIKSTAAGAYQILAPIFDFYKEQLNLPDFSPSSQDKIALQMIKECHAMADIDAGHFEKGIVECVSRWASLPGSPYGQHQNALAQLQAGYVAAGGVVSA